MCLCLLFPIATLQAAPLTVTVLLSESSEPYLEFSEALRRKLLKKNVSFKVIDDPDDLIHENGLVIGVGMKAATVIADSDTHAILNVLIPKTGHEKLLREYPQRAASRSFSAIYLDQPFERQVRLIESLLPGKRRVGVLYDSFPADELSQFRQRLARHQMSLHEQKIGPNLPLNAALQEVLKMSDVLLALPDASIYNSSTIRNILLATYRRGNPVIGFSPGYVKAGALAAVFSTPAQIAEQAANAIQQFGETRTLPAAQYPLLFEVMINEQVARSLELAIKSPEDLHEEIGSIKGDMN